MFVNPEKWSFQFKQLTSNGQHFLTLNQALNIILFATDFYKLQLTDGWHTGSSITLVWDNRWPLPACIYKYAEQISHALAQNLLGDGRTSVKFL